MGQRRRTTSAFFSFAKASENGGSVLSEIAGCALHFPLLIERACVDFHFCADGAFVVGERFEVDAHPVVLIRAFVFQEERCVAELRNDEIGVAVAGEIRDGDGARLREFDGIEMHFFGDVGPAFCAEIAEQAEFAAAAGFAGGDEIEPAVVVVIDGGNSPAALPAEIRKRDALEMLAVDVAPEADAGRACVRESEIHPAIFVEVESDDADGGRQIFFFEIDCGERSEFSFARI